MAAIDTGTHASVQLVLENEASHDVSGRMLTVIYKPSASAIEVPTCDSTNGWVLRGTTLTGVSFAAGNVLGARVRASGRMRGWPSTSGPRRPPPRRAPPAASRCARCKSAPAGAHAGLATPAHMRRRKP